MILGQEDHHEIEGDPETLTRKASRLRPLPATLLNRSLAD